MYTVENFAGFFAPARTTTVATITSLTTTPYGIGDVVNPSGLIVLDNVAPALGVPRKLTQIRCVEVRASGSAIGGDFRFWFYRDTFTLAAQGDAIAVPSDLSIIAGSVLTTAASWSSSGSTYAEYVKNMQGANAQDFTLGDGSQHFYLAVEARSANTYAANATLRFEFTWE